LPSVPAGDPAFSFFFSAGGVEPVGFRGKDMVSAAPRIQPALIPSVVNCGRGSPGVELPASSVLRTQERQ
jgi:hypothetical protein